MKVIVAGSSGLIGTPLCERLIRDKREVVRLLRCPTDGGKDRRWQPAIGQLSPKALDGADVVINLAGANVAEESWSEEYKTLIRNSRVKGAKLLANAIAKMPEPPLFVNASAIGYYGDRGAEVCSESTEPGEGFLSEVCQEWEAAAMTAADRARVVCLRFGVVLSCDGGALKRMLLPFSLCLGGKLGSGDQYMSWVSVDDAVGAICHVLLREELVGPVNVVSPNPVTNAAFAQALGKEMGRPTFLSLPEGIVKLIHGEMGDELLLSSTRVTPEALKGSGYRFAHPNLAPALKSLLRRR